METLTVQGASWRGDPHDAGSTVVQATPARATLAVPGCTGKSRSRPGRGRARRASVCGGGPVKITAASQAALGEAQQSFAGAKTT